MNDPLDSDEEVLARLVRKAGDPSVSPNPQYAQTLRAMILDRAGPEETVAPVTEGIRKADVIPSTVERTRQMKRIAKFAVAATILVALGILVSWMTTGGDSTNIAFAAVAKALDSVRTATCDFTQEIKNPMDGKTQTIKMKSFFLAPSRERSEMSTSIGSAKSSSVLILDHQTMKGIILAPEKKLATTIDLSKSKKPSGPSNPFEMVRQLVREGSGSLGQKVESLGKKEIDGHVAIGFRTRINMVDPAFWADPKTGRLIRVEVDFAGGNGHGVMSNFRYDMELDRSLFSLEPPAGYTVTNMQAKMPVEEDLVNTLRFIAEHNDGTFPAVLGMNNREFQQAIQAASISENQKLLKEPETAKFLKDLQAKHGKDRDGFMKAGMKSIMRFTQKLTQKYMQGMMFYNMLTSQNDSHYVGGGVKRGTPDRPIFWYKPTGAEKYRVIYADLSVKEASPAEIKNFPKASEGYTPQTRNIGAFVGNEKDLIETLRVSVAKQNGLLPPTLNASDLESGIKVPLEKEIEAKYGKSREARIKALQDVEFMMAHMDIGLIMTFGRALGFLYDLKPENDSHYAGKGVKLGTPDRPIFWYKPTGSEKYHVIYADLSVKEMTADDVKKLPKAKAK
ncbi:MAG: LolA family protein [Thermoguttaceae bacterium]